MTVVGSLQVSPPVGGGEAHAAGPNLCRQGSFLLQRVFLHYNIKEYLYYNILRSPFLERKNGRKKRKEKREEKKQISGEVHRDKTDKRSLVSSRWTH
jgi:hypothetical protein